MARSLAPEEAAPHELEFVAAAASWINLIIDKGSSLPFSEARIEGRSKNSQKRRDLSLIGKDRKIPDTPGFSGRIPSH
jgi:hypothetical protein